MVSHLRLTQAETKTWSNTEYRVMLQVAQTTERVSRRHKKVMHFIFPRNVYVIADALLCSVSSSDAQLKNLQQDVAKLQPIETLVTLSKQMRHYLTFQLDCLCSVKIGVAPVKYINAHILTFQGKYGTPALFRTIFCIHECTNVQILWVNWGYNNTVTFMKVFRSQTLFMALITPATFVHRAGPCTVVTVAHRHYVDEAYFNTISWQPVCCCGWLASPLNGPDWLMSGWIFWG